MIIKITAKTIILSRILRDITGLDEWAIYNGLDPDYTYDVELSEAVLEGLRESLQNS